MIRHKTKFIQRTIKGNQAVKIYDLDGTIIDSSHRIKLREDGSLDLEHWKNNCTREQIFQDSLLPMYWQLRADYMNGDIIIICTAREFNKYDLEYLHTMNVYYDYLISRPKDCKTIDHELKKLQLTHLFHFNQFKNMAKAFYDDNANNLKAISQLGSIDCVHAGEWNNQYL